MLQTIYVDTLFAINFCMDFISIYIAGKIMKNSPNILRYLISSVLGGAYSVMSTVVSIDIYITFIFNIVISVLMVAIAMNQIKNRKKLLTSWFIFILTSFLLGGIMTGIYNFFNQAAFLKSLTDSSSGFVYGEIPIHIFLILLVVSVFIAYLFGNQSIIAVKHKDYKIEITIFNRKSTFRSIVDSGNLLKEPLSGTPCIVINYEKLINNIPLEVKSLIEEKKLTINSDQTELLKYKVRFIPAKSIGGNRLLVGFKPDKVTIIEGKNRKAIECILIIDSSNSIKFENSSDIGAIIPIDLI